MMSAHLMSCGGPLRTSIRRVSVLLAIASLSTACGSNEEELACEGTYTFADTEFLVTEPVKKLPLGQRVGTGNVDNSVCGRGLEKVVLRRIEGVDPALAVGSPKTSSSVELIWVSTNRVDSLDAPPDDLAPYLD